MCLSSFFILLCFLGLGIGNYFDSKECNTTYVTEVMSNKCNVFLQYETEWKRTGRVDCSKDPSKFYPMCSRQSHIESVSDTECRTFCDFEEDLCGWEQDSHDDGDWKRISYYLDHTEIEDESGHVITLSSSGKVNNFTARLISPPYDKYLAENACFTFFYQGFIGSQIGRLRIYQTPTGFTDLFRKNESYRQKHLVFEVKPDTETWLRGIARLNNLKEDFQIIIEGVSGLTSDDVKWKAMWDIDIQLDDTSILQGNSCIADPDFPVWLKSDTCTDRCELVCAPENVVCGCTDACAATGTCCDNFIDVCKKGTSIPFGKPETSTKSSLLNMKTDLHIKQHSRSLKKIECNCKHKVRNCYLGQSDYDQNDGWASRFINYVNTEADEIIFVHKYCPLPPISFGNVFRSYGINPDKIPSAELIFMNSKTDTSQNLQGYHFTGLSLKYLEITYISEDGVIGEPNVDFLEPLTKLVDIKVQYTVMPPMPKNSIIQRSYFTDGYFTNNYGGCSELTQLNLIRWGAAQDLELNSCQKLTSIEMESMSIDSMNNVLRGANSPALEHVTITKSSLNEPDLKEVYRYKRSKIYESKGSMLMLLLSKIASLQNLTLDSVTEFDMCYYFNNNEKNNLVSGFSKLGFLKLGQKVMADLECINRRVPTLKELYLYPKEPIMVKQIVTSPGPLKVTFLNSIKNIIFSQSDYETLIRQSESRVTIQGDIIIECDCQHAYLARALKENLFRVNSVFCKDIRKQIEQTKAEETDCTKTQCGECVCREMWASGETVADCRGTNAARIPRVDRLSRLLASRCHIQLREEDIPDTLIFLDLSYNDLVLIVDEDVIRKLFSVKNRVILLEGNNFACDCKNKYFIETLQKNHEQVKDYKNLTCAGESGQFLRNVDIGELCAVPPVADNSILLIITIVCGVSLVGVIFAIFLNYRYGEEIRVFLYARGWCLCCTSEDDDVDQIYDAFVSVCHEDESLAYQEFVPQLDQLGYKICVHYRDWAPGELIPNQIYASVMTSRRTIIMLSKNFVMSLWGSLEFRTAHTRALDEGIPRVIVVVLDDVIEMENLELNIRSYLRTNTYVKWGDPWFWDKMKYALRRRREERDTTRINATNHRTTNNAAVPPDDVRLALPQEDINI